MADSTYLKHTVEPFIVEWVSRRIGIELKPKQVVVGLRTDGTMVHFSFDGVSGTGKVGLLVSTSLTVKPGGTRKLHTDAFILLNTPLERRLMAFISDDVRVNFLNKCDGLLPLRQIEMLVCNDLPTAMQKSIAAFQADAKAEVGDNGRQRQPGGQRR